MIARRYGLLAALSVLVVGLDCAPALAAPVSVGHSGWTWGNPTPQGKPLREVAFDGATGFAVGDFGTVVRSQDSGATWTGLPSGTINPLSVVQEVNPSVVVVGGGCTVRESVNGGASFVSLPINPTESSCPTNVASFSFSDPSTGYVELADGTIFFTNDGGQTVQAKTSAPINSGTATDLHFVSPSTGFAVSGAASGGSGGGVIERTTDSASSWTQVASSSHGVNAVTFLSPTKAFAVGDQDTLLESTNGGATWTQRALGLPAGAGRFDLAHISCTSATTCLISTKDGNELIRTADGGQTGTIVNPSNQRLFDVAFSTGSSVIGAGGNGATVLSADGGQTFPMVISNRLRFSPNINTVGIRPGGVAASAYVPGKSGQIAATVNGGASWNLLRAPTTNDVADLAFPTTSRGFELESDGTLRTTSNGGVGWASLDTGVANAATLAVPSAKTVLLIGPVGINRSTDGGSTFNAVRSKVVYGTKRRKRTIAVARLALAHSQTLGKTVVAWGQSGLYESTDGGRAWRLIPRPIPGVLLRSVSFVSSQTGYVLTADSNRLYFTRNSGRKWTVIDSLGYPDRDLTTVSFSSATEGIVTLDSTVQLGNPNFDSVDVLRTGDGGRTWQPEVIDGYQYGQGLATARADYYAGYDSSNALAGLFATTNGGVSSHRSALSISIGRKRLSVKGLHRRGSKVTVQGRLRPVTSVGEQVLLSWRTVGKNPQHELVTVATNGAFTVVIPGITTTTTFVAQAVGNGVYGGVGTRAARLTVSRR